MNYVKLIAEAERLQRALERRTGDPDMPRASTCESLLLGQLAAALRELAPPEGWEISAYQKGQDGPCVVRHYGKQNWFSFPYSKPGEFHTASAAMAALDGKP